MFRRLSRQLDTLTQKVELLDRVLMLKEPESIRAAEAYEGLRRAVIAGAQTRSDHLVDLAEIDAAVQRGESSEELAQLLHNLCRRIGLERTTDVSIPELFDVVAGEGERLEVRSAAYVDANTGGIIRRGSAQAHRDPEVVNSDSEPVDRDQHAMEVQA